MTSNVVRVIKHAVTMKTIAAYSGFYNPLLSTTPLQVCALETNTVNAATCQWVLRMTDVLLTSPFPGIP